MNISELIEQLEHCQRTFGDISVALVGEEYQEADSQIPCCDVYAGQLDTFVYYDDERLFIIQPQLDMGEMMRLGNVTPYQQRIDELERELTELNQELDLAREKLVIAQVEEQEREEAHRWHSYITDLFLAIGDRDALRPVKNSIRADERKRAQQIIGGFTELDHWWKVALCAAIENPDWSVGERGKAFYERLQAMRETDCDTPQESEQESDPTQYEEQERCADRILGLEAQRNRLLKAIASVLNSVGIDSDMRITKTLEQAVREVQRAMVDDFGNEAE